MRPLSRHRFVFVSIALMLVAATPSRAEDVRSDSRDALSRWSLGLALSGLGSDWGTGLALATPSFSGSGLSLALGATEYSYAGGSSYDCHYTDVALSAATRSFLTDNFRAYQRLGFGALFPSALLASRTGFRLFLNLGLEFFTGMISFYGELGLSVPISNAKADRVPGTPHYATGAVTTVGARWYF